MLIKIHTLHYVVGSNRLVMRTINLATVGDWRFLAAVPRIVTLLLPPAKRRGNVFGGSVCLSVRLCIFVCTA